MITDPNTHAVRLDRNLILKGGGQLKYFRDFYPTPEADALYASLLAETPWETNRQTARMVWWAGSFDYAYTGFSHRAAPWTPLLLAIREKVEASVFGRSEGQFQGVLLNLYRDGRDGVGFHADDEPMIRKGAPIASLSLGAVRKFVLRCQIDRRERPIEMSLGHGSCLIMGGTLQSHWKHSVPKQPEIEASRINLTFRQYTI